MNDPDGVPRTCCDDKEVAIASCGDSEGGWKPRRKRGNKRTLGVADSDTKQESSSKRIRTRIPWQMGTDEEALLAENVDHGSESVKSLSSLMNQLSVSANPVVVTPPSDAKETSEAQLQKTRQQDMKPEQLEKLSKREGTAAPEKRSDPRGFYCLSSGITHRFMLPEANGKKVFCSQGWLITVAKDLSMNPLHPFAHDITKLPHMKQIKDWSIAGQFKLQRLMSLNTN
ncbi:hypothetical protein Ddye_020017 [Dipteronia dyeriana]|uniref:Uncharacterized protein n=1 Tax=Dipteronia dyeriana TaxID=168575 RepID=A0AAD9WWA5_9ROSI|nr:hypothetical protein Ddye_020017 [Dipteronia dyeriana]